MPPKPAARTGSASPGKKGGKKLSKKEKKRLADLKKKEEEEQARREEEERIRAEQEKERLRLEEEERIRREIEEKRLAEERQRIGLEEQEFNKGIDERLKRLTTRKLEVQKVDEWNEFLLCSSLPDIDNEVDMNSFLSIWRDNPNVDMNDRDIKSDFDSVNMGVELCDKLEKGMLEAKVTEPAKHKIHLKRLIDVSNTAQDSLDDISAYLMQYNDQYVNPENNQYIKVQPNAKYGLWMNLGKQQRLKTIEFEEIGVRCELIKAMAVQKIAVRAVQTKYDILTLTTLSKPLFEPIGGLLFIDILAIPPPSTQIGVWKRRQVTNLATKVERKSYTQTDSDGNEQAAPPTQVSFIVPDNVIVRREIPHVAWWDKKNSAWKLNGISGTKFDPKTRRLEFSTVQLTTALALVHQRTFDAPFDKWYITPLHSAGRRFALFSITPKVQTNTISALAEIIILAHDDKCKLISPNLPELTELYNKYMPPRELLVALSRAGINLLFEDTDSEFSDTPTKNPALEQRAYSDIALVSSICTITNSKWNHDPLNGASRAVFRVSKKLFDPDAAPQDLKKSDIDMEFVRNNLRMNFKADDKWDLMTYEMERCCFIDCTETSETFNPSPQPNVETHLNVYTALEQKGNANIAKYIRASDMLLGDTIKKLLMAVKPLSW